MLANRVVQLEEEANVEREEKVWGSPVDSSCYRSVRVGDGDVGSAAIRRSAPVHTL